MTKENLVKDKKSAKLNSAEKSTYIFREEAAQKILREIAGGSSLSAVCKLPGIPCRSVVSSWIAEDVEGFKARYDVACRARAHGLVEDLLDIADDSSGDYKIDSFGVSRVDKENIARSRLKVDTRKWIASKLLKAYSEKSTFEELVSVIEASKKVDLSRLSAEELKQLEQLTSKIALDQ
jgi:hypothetical protein